MFREGGLPAPLVFGLLSFVLEAGVTSPFAAYSDFNVNGVHDCLLYSPDPIPNPTPPGDYVGTVRFSLGTLAAGQAKTVKIVYRGL